MRLWFSRSHVLWRPFDWEHFWWHELTKRKYYSFKWLMGSYITVQNDMHIYLFDEFCQNMHVMALLDMDIIRITHITNSHEQTMCACSYHSHYAPRSCIFYCSGGTVATISMSNHALSPFPLMNDGQYEYWLDPRIFLIFFFG